MIEACFVAVVDIQPLPLSSQPSSEEQLLLLGQGLTSRPADGGGGDRGRSVSFSFPLLPGRHLQPLLQADKSQQRCADAGSSILKQVLPMFPHLPGTPSPADTGYGSVKHGRTTRSSPPQLFIILPIANLPAIVHDLVTMTDVVCIDIAVAQATQTLQQLQQQPAALYSGMGAKYMPQYYPYHPD